MDNAAQSRDDLAFNGTKYLVDATGERQYAITYVNGKPNRNIRAFDRDGEVTFKPGEKIYAFEDNVQLKTGAGGKMTVSALAVQITVSPEGKPNNLKQMTVDYDMSFDVTPGAPAASKYKLEPASAALLAQQGFDASFPKELGGALATNDFDSTVGAGGLVLPPAKSVGTSVPFPPQHDNGANFARAALEAEKAAPAPAPQPEPDAVPKPVLKAELVRTIGDEDDYHGHRFLLDANNSRQYAVRYENGTVRPPLQVYAGNAQDGGFGKNETIFALDDEVTMRVNDKFTAIYETVLFQIRTDETGKPRNLKQQSVEYAMSIAKEGDDTIATIRLTQESAQRLDEAGFGQGVPVSFSQKLDTAKFTSPGVLDARQARDLPWPPHHDGSAFIARMNADAQQPAPTKRAAPAKTAAAPANDDTETEVDTKRYSMPDKTTLVEQKTIGVGERLKLVFNFESRRVTEIVPGTGFESYKFSDYETSALKKAAATLKKLGGTPGAGF